ncbi:MULTISPECIES: histidinol-phosphate transaminase [Aneurinibacillus]|uniref:Histidinol-phosphate aminotransferase n=1 Tax=Aneurinibacillus thermoaerophilus TaxID=143495 RepID=A0A1G8BS13_ANETH|nr:MULTISPECIES: histidinol-phosphate transaminase [Aneurinibacillus]AMA73563.1 histidinol-phosphate aminotransferase [Aneurinibacillus sp. XH2]MED0674953.1 histidinol-phosphate transaminase [Aneurinibacillus thermoaerophilus]MED0679646.1 histidinol-phosphate transaminase [Aneurinibacillus thermoaerophilus]MED0737356.1 histidinol-phosphate transaminase [Aneurinibacillus thermoaerophilus]MED0756205.1 histidinol-phosphate transaminase [Aneurinibacillus thermoaerophilus]
MIPKTRIVNLPVYEPGKPIEDVKRELGLTEVIKLASNENPFGCSPRVKETIVSQLDNLPIYPDGACLELRSALASFLNVKEEELIFGNGSDEIVMLLARAYLEPGTNTIMAAPTFVVYKTNATIEGAEVIEVPCVEGKHDLNGMLAKVNENTRVVWVCNPNNPTGTIVTEEELIRFLDQVPEHVLVVLDEAYVEYVKDDAFPRSLELLRKYKNLIILRTFSKIYGLAALRVGYGIAAEEIIDKLNRVREPFNVNHLGQKAALAALADQEFVARCKAANMEGLEQVYAGLDEIGVPYYRSETNFVYAIVERDTKEVFQEMLKQGVIIRAFPQAIRVTIGSKEQNEKMLAALKAVLAPAKQ